MIFQKFKDFDKRQDEISFRGEILNENNCEMLAEIFRRVLFKKIDLHGAIENDKV